MVFNSVHAAGIPCNCILYLSLISYIADIEIHIHNVANCVLVLCDIRLVTHKKSSKIYKCQERLSLYHGGQIRLCMTTL